MEEFYFQCIFQVLLITYEDGPYCRGLACVGTGIWTGLFFAISGGVGLVASQRPSYCMVTAFMVMSIISTLFAIPLIVLAGIDIGTGRHYRYYPGIRFVCGLQMITALAQGIVAIVTAVFSCRVTCRTSHHHSNVAFTRAANQEFTDVPITTLPTVSSPLPAETSNAAGASGSGRLSSPPAYEEKQQRPQEHPLQDDEDQDPWARFE